MEIDVERIVGAARRTVSVREHGGRPARVVSVRRRYDTSLDDLWDALTNEARIPRWFLPVSGDLRPGGRYQFEGNAGGDILECTAPSRLHVTWEFHGQVSWLTVELEEHQDGGTLLALEHVAHVPDEVWDQFGPGAAGVGWDSGLLGLEMYFGTGAVRPDNAAEWLASEQGRAFVRAASDAWRDASIASGTDPDRADAAAERTRAAYTGEGGGSDGASGA